MITRKCIVLLRLEARWQTLTQACLSNSGDDDCTYDCADNEDAYDEYAHDDGEVWMIMKKC